MNEWRGNKKEETKEYFEEYFDHYPLPFLTRKDRIKKEKKGEREKRNAQATEIFSIPLSKTNNTTVGPWLYVARWNGNDPSEWRPRLPW